VLFASEELAFSDTKRSRTCSSRTCEESPSIFKIFSEKVVNCWRLNELWSVSRGRIFGTLLYPSTASPAVLLGIGDAFDSSFDDGCGADLYFLLVFRNLRTFSFEISAISSSDAVVRAFSSTFSSGSVGNVGEPQRSLERDSSPRSGSGTDGDGSVGEQS